MTILNEQFFKVSNAMFCYGLTPVQFAAYCYLICCAGSKGKCWPGMKTIAACCGCSQTTARNAIQELERRGFIVCVPTFKEQFGRNRQTSNTYFIQDLPPLPKKKQEPAVYKDENGQEVGA